MINPYVSIKLTRTFSKPTCNSIKVNYKALQTILTNGKFYFCVFYPMFVEWKWDFPSEILWFPFSARLISFSFFFLFFSFFKENRKSFHCVNSHFFSTLETLWNQEHYFLEVQKFSLSCINNSCRYDN